MTIVQLTSTGDIPVRSVSYSETSGYLLCHRKWEYGYGRSLKRVNESFSLKLGSAVHKLLEVFYRSILSEGDDLKKQGTKVAWDRALALTEVAYTELVEGGFEDRDNKAPLREIVFDFYLNRDLKLEPFVLKGWRIMAVEYEAVLDTVMDEETSETIRTPVVVDLIVLDPTGKTVVVDHKCLQDFYDNDAASLQPQIPLYMAVLRGLNFKIDYGYYNMLRNRAIKGSKPNKEGIVTILTEAGIELPEKYSVKDLDEIAAANKITLSPGATPEQRWSYLELKPNGQRVRRSFMEQLSVAQEIITLTDMSEEERDLKMHRVANKMVCQSCSFKDLCTMELQGGNVPLLIRTEYEIRERKVFAAETEEGDVD